MNVLKEQIENTQRFISNMSEIQQQRNYMKNIREIDQLNQPEWSKNYTEPVSFQYSVGQAPVDDRIVIQSDSLLEKG
eukprot:CAMPEP_0170498180 /NCGR_PEP_ID=MMETSP0208-20121228/27074_1 /TAXON_ID=197538 /ORGANISM="Strombidium inclinatum, Strain S3" /LENGTH=76 /DNA_ID=CAMNT_0010775279 /DNA_START=1845 /DNA_END=2075 /DNA_ORIENTATION=+